MTAPKPFQMSRRIEIDAAHRVPHHGSKCRQLHGHRYVIEASCVAHQLGAGEESGMVIDFGFLKDYMNQVIFDHCDHGTILWHDDPLLSWLGYHEGDLTREGAWELGIGKVAVCPYVPTAENLCHWWYDRLRQMVEAHRSGLLLEYVKVWETPNCFAIYPGGHV